MLLPHHRLHQNLRFELALDRFNSAAFIQADQVEVVVTLWWEGEERFFGWLLGIFNSFFLFYILCSSHKNDLSEQNEKNKVLHRFRVFGTIVSTDNSIDRYFEFIRMKGEFRMMTFVHFCPIKTVVCLSTMKVCLLFSFHENFEAVG
jgi:hypothetical protein